jgi:hypothetical protein
MTDQKKARDLSEIYDEIHDLSNRLAIVTDTETRQAIATALRAVELRLNQYVEDQIYSLTTSEKAVLDKFKSRLDLDRYIELMLLAADGDEVDEELETA